MCIYTYVCTYIYTYMHIYIAEGKTLFGRNTVMQSGSKKRKRTWGTISPPVNNDSSKSLFYTTISKQSHDEQAHIWRRTVCCGNKCIHFSVMSQIIDEGEECVIKSTLHSLGSLPLFWPTPRALRPGFPYSEPPQCPLPAVEKRRW